MTPKPVLLWNSWSAPSLVGFQNTTQVCSSVTVPFTWLPPLIHLFQSYTWSLSKSHPFFPSNLSVITGLSQSPPFYQAPYSLLSPLHFQYLSHAWYLPHQHLFRSFCTLILLSITLHHFQFLAFKSFLYIMPPCHVILSLP